MICHARLYVDETLEDGSVVHWNLELPSPVGLMRKEWRRNDLEPGENVSIKGIHAKEYKDIGIAQFVLDGSGKALFSGI